MLTAFYLSLLLLKSLGILKGRNSCQHICPSEASKSSMSCNSLISERMEVKLVSMEPERYFLNVYTKNCVRL